MPFFPTMVTLVWTGGGVQGRGHFPWRKGGHRRHFCSSLSTRLRVRRTLGAVNGSTPCAIIFTATKGAYDMSLKSFFL